MKNRLNSIRVILTREEREIFSTAFLLMLPVIVTKMLGILNNALQATLISNGIPRQSFVLADQIPDAISTILFAGVMGAIVVPVLIQAHEKGGKEEFLKVYRTVLNIVMILFALASVVIFFTADSLIPWIINVANPLESVGDPMQIAAMTKTLMISNMILGLSVCISSGLQSYHRLLVPQLAPLFYNLGRILGIIFLINSFSPENQGWALVYGTLIGSVLHLLIQLPLAFKFGLEYKFYINLRLSYVKQMARMALPRVFALSTDKLAILFCAVIITGLGANSEFNYADSLANLIPSVVGYAFATASLPTMMSLFIKQDYSELKIIVYRSINQILFLATPVVVAILILRLPIVRLALGFAPGTLFSRDDTYIVAWTLLFFGLGLLFECLSSYLYRVFFAAGNSRYPLFISVISFLVTIIVAFLFSNLFSHSSDYSIFSIPWTLENFLQRGTYQAGIGGVALAVSLGSFTEVILQLLLIKSKILKISFRNIAYSVMNKLLPTAAMTTTMYVMYKTWDSLALPIDASPNFAGSTTLNLFILTSITCATSFLVYYLLCFVFKVEELSILRKVLNPIFKIAGIKIT